MCYGMNTSITTDSILSTSGLLQQNSSHLHCRHKERSDLQPNSITSTLRRLVTHSDWTTSRRLSWPHSTRPVAQTPRPASIAEIAAEFYCPPKKSASHIQSAEIFSRNIRISECNWQNDALPSVVDGKYLSSWLSRLHKCSRVETY